MAFNVEDSSLLWSYTSLSEISNSVSIADISGDGKLDVVFGTLDELIVLNGEDGLLLRSVPTPDSINSAPIVGDLDIDGELDLVIGCSDNAVYSLRFENAGMRVFWQGLGGTSDFTRVGSAGYIDEDNDMLSSYSESIFNSNPHSNDSDSDNIHDGLEISMGLSPVFADSDFDTIDDYSQIQLKSESQYLVYWYSETCPACTAIKQEVLDFADENEAGIKIYFMDAAKTTGTNYITQMTGTPSLLTVVNGVIVDLNVGSDLIPKTFDEINNGSYSNIN